MTTTDARQVGRLRPLKLSRRVADDLVRRIVNHDLNGDQPPSEQDICEFYGVSKTVAREVIGQLEAMRLVQVHHGRRMVIRSPDEWDYLDQTVVGALDGRREVKRLLTELHELRLLIEPPAAARAATAATSSQLERLGELLEAMKARLDDPDAYLDLDVEFHATLFASVGNRITMRVLDSVTGLLRVSRRATHLLPGALERATSDHAAIFDAVARRDESGARRAMEQHLEWVPAGWIDWED